MSEYFVLFFLQSLSHQNKCNVGKGKITINKDYWNLNMFPGLLMEYCPYSMVFFSPVLRYWLYCRSLLPLEYNYQCFFYEKKILPENCWTFQLRVVIVLRTVKRSLGKLPQNRNGEDIIFKWLWKQKTKKKNADKHIYRLIDRKQKGSLDNKLRKGRNYLRSQDSLFASLNKKIEIKKQTAVRR